MIEKFIMNTQNITIYIEKDSAAIRYVLSFVFEEVLRCKVTYSLKNNDIFFEQNNAHICYGKPLHNNHTCLWFDYDAFGWEYPTKNLISREKITTFLHLHPTEQFTFDPFLAIFQLLTLSHEKAQARDTHGRVKAEGLYSLHLPLCDIIINNISKKINSFFPTWRPKKISFTFTPTYDIDMAWKHLNKPFIASFAYFFRHLLALNIPNIREQIQVLLHKKEDSFFCFQHILSYHEGEECSKPIFFIQIGNRDKFDKNTSYKNKKFRDLLRFIAKNSDIGLHPSYHSHLKSDVLAGEKKRLEDIILRPVTSSRQHYLKLDLPKTYDILLKNNIKNDYTMGFAECIGFRAGTAHSFLWFNPTENCVTDLRVHSFQVMDVTLKSYNNFSPETAWHESLQLIKQVERYGGNFCTIWHNSSFDAVEWNGWDNYYLKLIKYFNNERHNNSK